MSSVSNSGGLAGEANKIYLGEGFEELKATMDYVENSAMWVAGVGGGLGLGAAAGTLAAPIAGTIYGGVFGAIAGAGSAWTTIVYVIYEKRFKAWKEVKIKSVVDRALTLQGINKNSSVVAQLKAANACIEQINLKMNKLSSDTTKYKECNALRHALILHKTRISEIAIAAIKKQYDKNVDAFMEKTAELYEAKGKKEEDTFVEEHIYDLREEKYFPKTSTEDSSSDGSGLESEFSGSSSSVDTSSFGGDDSYSY